MKATIISIIIALALIGGVVVLGGNNRQNNGNNISANNVSIVGGKQIIEIRAKGGYSPRKSVAKAGIPTIIRFDAGGAFDCSSFVRIPSMNIGQNLSQSSTTDIDLGSPKEGILNGTCAMGMYPFEIEFQN
ncbi:MAG: hypothetical protein NTX96_02855 [Candidatus Zambryskibacteria bacterium]|nr:hypothetical protein [Candidatus Zambryskibacteria bacterium]